MGGSAVPAGVIADAITAAKAYLRLEGGVEDALLSQLARAAIGLGEQFCAQALVAREFDDAVAASSAWQRLPGWPVTAIDAVTSGSGAVLAIGSYAIDIDADGAGWVRTTAPATPATSSSLRVAYRAGTAADWGGLPPALAQGVVLLIAHLFAHEADDRAPPAAVAALWRPFRRLRVGQEPRR